MFIQPLTYEKTAGEVTLQEDPNAWPSEILDELYKQVPYIADFHPHVSMDRVDAEQAYGFGFVEISNKSEAQMGTDPREMSAAGIRTVKIPVVIKGGKLQPFDILVTDTGKALPLSEPRIKQALFRPTIFDATSKTPGDNSLIGQLYPPYRQNYGFGGGGMSMPADGMGKTSSVLEEYLTFGTTKKSAEDIVGKEQHQKARAAYDGRKHASVLTSVLPTVNRGDLDSFWSTIEHDPSLRAQFRKNAAATQKTLELLATVEPESPTKLASALDASVPPTVVQIARHSDGYLVKTANHLLWEPTNDVIDRGQLYREYGDKVAMAVDMHGAVTVAVGAEAAAEMQKRAAMEPVEKSGLYKVLTSEGKELVGFVATNLIDTDGEPTPLALFTNGSQVALQAEVFGEKAGDAGNLPTGPVQGYGFFYTTAPEGVHATIPFDFSSAQSAEGSTSHVGQTFDGRPISVSLSPNLQVPTPVEDGHLAIPAAWQWSPLHEDAFVELAGKEPPVEHGEAQEPQQKEAVAAVTIRSDGQVFTLSGAPVEKLAADEREFLNIDDAMFVLAGLGVEQGFGTLKLAHAMSGAEPVVIKVGRVITPSRFAKAEAYASAKVKMASCPSLRRDLIKEAASIPDSLAVDTVLSLGFINPGNIMTFVNHLPVIDETQQRLCELLLAARLGLSEVPVSALERTIRSLEEVITGLKVLAFGN